MSPGVLGRPDRFAYCLIWPELDSWVTHIMNGAGLYRWDGAASAPDLLSRLERFG